MNTIQRRGRHGAKPSNTPLALHLKRQRLWHGERTLGQAELAALAGISTRQLRTYEACTRLPRTVESLLAVATALNVHLEDLVARSALDALRARVRHRREASRCRQK